MTLNAAAPRTPTVIQIQGRASINTLAERAALNIHVSDTGFDKDVVSKNVITTVNTIQSELDQHCPRLENGDISPSAPITYYSIASLSLSEAENYNDEGHRSTNPEKKLYTADSSIDIHFRNFGTLGDIAVRLSAMPHVLLRGIDWRLTDAKQAWLDEEVRMQALKNAIERANAYARIIGREKVICVKIEDDGEFWPQQGMLRQTMRKVSASDASGVGVGIEFEARKVQVDGTVKVEFHAE